MSNFINRIIIRRNMLRFKLVNSSLYRDLLSP
jgi:hypothetical protein